MKKASSKTNTKTTPAKSFRETGVPLYPSPSPDPATVPPRASAESPNLRRPAHTIRIGPLQASIWENETAQGKMFSVKFDRSYRDGEQWKRSASFGRNNLLMVARLAEQAFDWIAQQPTQPKAIAA